MNVLLLCRTEIFALNVLRCLADSKVKSCVFGHGKMWSVSLSKHCREYVQCYFTDFRNPGAGLIEKINTYCETRKIDFVIPTDYETAYLLAKIKRHLKRCTKPFPVSEPDVLEMLDDKWEFAKLLAANDLPFPKTFLVETFEQLEKIDLPFPRIVKPFRVRRVWSGGIGASYLKKNQAEYLASGRDKGSCPLLVQEFIPGIDIDLSILAHEGKIVSWTIQKWIKNDTLQFMSSKEILDLGRKVVAAVNYDGVAHFDLRIDERDGSVKFLECNPRFWGTLRASMWNGVNFVGDGLMVGQGKISMRQNVSKDITYVLPATILSKLLRGKLSEIRNIPDASKQDLKQIISDPLSCLCSVMRQIL